MSNIGEHTDTGRWTQEAVRSYIVWGSFFAVTGILGVISGLLLFFKAIPAVAEDNKPYLRKILLPCAIIGLIPSPGVIIVGILLFFTWRMYADDRFDFFGLLLEDVSRTRRRVSMGGPTPTSVEPRDMYATGYEEQQSLYADDYATAAYGAGEGAYEAQTSLIETEHPEETPEAGPETVPACATCGKTTEWIEEYGRYYCYDCDAYV